MPPPRSGRTLAAVLFTDIVNSTAVAEELGDRRWKTLVDRHHRLVRQLLKRHGGREQDTAGDGFFAAFTEPASAIRCACEAAEAVRELGIEIRAGVHFGECERIGPKLGGITVVVGARIMSLGGAGDVLVSGTTAELTRGAGFGTSDRGSHTLKGVDDEWRVLSVDAIDGVPRPAPLDPEEAAARRAAIEPDGRTRRSRVPLLVGAAVVIAAAVGAWAMVAGPGAAEALVPGPDTIARVAEAGDGFDAVVDVGAAAFPDGIAAGAGRLWVANVSARTLLQVDPATGETQVLGTPSVPTGVAFADGRVWVTYGFTGDPARRVDVLDPGDPVLVPSGIDVPDGSYPVAAGPGAVWIADPLGSTLLRYDPATDEGTTVRLPEGSGPVALGDAGSHVWVAAGRTAAVYRLDAADLQARPERFGTGGAIPTALSVASDGSVWVAARDADGVLGLSPDGTTLVDLALDEACDGPSGIVALDQAVWVSCSYSSHLVRLDRADGSVLATLDVDGDPGPMALDEDGALWVATRSG